MTVSEVPPAQLEQPPALFGFILALANPAFHPELTMHGQRFRKTIINVRAQGVQRHATPVIHFRAGDFRAARSARRNGSLMPSAPKSLAVCNNFFIARRKETPALHLQGDVFSDQLRDVEFRCFNLNDINVNFLARLYCSNLP